MFFGIVPLFLVQEREGAVKRVSQETCLVFIVRKYRYTMFPVPEVYGMLSRKKACTGESFLFPSQLLSFQIFSFFSCQCAFDGLFTI